MQKEIKKRAKFYGVAAVLSALVLSALCYNLGTVQFQFPTASAGLLKTFSSYEELRHFLTVNSKTQGAFPFYGPWDISIMRNTVEGFDVLTPSLNLYSTTNIQVAGVDEADIVKTDGEYIYLVSGNQVFILKAYPPEEAEILSKLEFNEVYPVEIFVNGNRLTVLGSRYVVSAWRDQGPFFVDIKTFANVYDISNKTNPTLLRNFTITGSYFSSRMIGEYVYFVVSQPAYIIYDTVVLPKIYSNGEVKDIGASEIQYSNASSDDYCYLFTTIVALNMQNPEEEPVHKTIMLSQTSSMYVSLSNIYITFPDQDGQTSIYRIRIENTTINCEANGKVLGRELNQFSMDEYNNYFRIATTAWTNGSTENSLYILDMNLSMVGKLENIAPGETIDSARFIGNRCYLSTSVVQRDPFFVIDVENASKPKILGYLKIPGFTRYLHPYDESHVIGIGRNENNKVKISFFDVSNVSAPIEIDNYEINGTWSDTLVLTEHKAFLFEKSKGMLAFPVSIYTEYSMWQGAYVFNLTLNSGIVLRGNVTHQNGASYWDSSYWIKRALYIENVLYTVSEMEVKLNSLEDLAFIKEIELN